MYIGIGRLTFRLDEFARPVAKPVVLIAGSLLGSLLGVLLKDIFPFLYSSQIIGFSPTTIDLAAITITLGLIIRINIATVIGFFIALFIYTRL